MSIRILTISFLSIFFLSGYAQGDTLGRYSPGFKFKDGLYFSFEDFRSNCPAVPIKEIKDEKGGNIPSIEDAESLYHYVNDSLVMIDVRSLYGYSDGGQVSLGRNNYFDRLVVIGTLCHVIHREEIIEYARGGLYEYNSIPIRREVKTEFILDMRTGEKLPFNPANLDFHISDDSELATLFAEKSRKQRRTSQYATLHAYNRKHPVYFSISRCY